MLDDLEEKRHVSFQSLSVQINATIFRVQWNTVYGATNEALSLVIEGDLNTIAAVINHARIQVELTYARLQNAEALVAHLQGQLGLKVPWEVGGEEYMHYKEEATLSKYREALDEVERLAVMRLFELSKLRMSQTGKFKSASEAILTCDTRV